MDAVFLPYITDKLVSTLLITTLGILSILFRQLPFMGPGVLLRLQTRMIISLLSEPFIRMETMEIPHSKSPL